MRDVGQKMKITWLGHSAFRVDAGKSVIMIDPFISANGKYKGTLDEASQGATHVLLTHGHDDHIGDAVQIAKNTGAQIVSNYEICMFLMAQGVNNINPGNTGGTVSCGDFKLSFTQAQHSSGTVVDGKSIYLGNPNGLIVNPDNGPSLYHMGDTDIFGDMALINEFHAPDIGIVPVGDRFTMSGKIAAVAVKRFFNFKAVLPCHYGTFDLLCPNADDFVAGLAGSATKVHVPPVGGSVSF